MDQLAEDAQKSSITEPTDQLAEDAQKSSITEPTDQLAEDAQKCYAAVLVAVNVGRERTAQGQKPGSHIMYSSVRVLQWQ
eukprot:1402263-Amphidinium_carterae.1